MQIIRKAIISARIMHEENRKNNMKKKNVHRKHYRERNGILQSLKDKKFKNL